MCPVGSADSIGAPIWHPFLFSVSTYQKREKLKPATDSGLRLLRDPFIGLVLVLLSLKTMHESSFFVLATLVFHCLAQAKLDRGRRPEPLSRRTGPRACPWLSPRRRTVRARLSKIPSEESSREGGRVR
jgi:hypothetical protein